MSRRYESLNLRRRYLWAAAQREGYEHRYWPGCFDRRPLRPLCAQRFKPRAHATQQWWGGQRFYRIDHWSMARVRAA